MKQYFNAKEEFNRLISWLNDKKKNTKPQKPYSGFCLFFLLHICRLLTDI